MTIWSPPVALALFLALAGTSATAGAAEPPTLLVDERHNEVVQREATKPPRYVIAAADALRLDARKFDFTRAGYPNLQPNAVHVIAKGREYFADWSDSGVTLLSVETLLPLNNAPRFDGFHRGEKWEIQVGRKEVDEAKHQISFKVQWANTVRVK